MAATARWRRSISYFLILSVVGMALQVATAREGVLGHLGVGAGPAGHTKSWTRGLLVFTLFLTIVSVLLRDPIAQAVGVKHDVGGGAGAPRRGAVARALGAARRRSTRAW